MSIKKLLSSVKDVVKNLNEESCLVANKTVLTNVSGKTTDVNKVLPYQKSIKLLKEVRTITSLTKKKQLFNYVWNKIQQEVIDFWKGKPDIVHPRKLKMYEDTRLCVMAFIIIMSESPEIYTDFKALSPFIE